MSLSTKYQVDPKIPAVLPFEKMYSIQPELLHGGVPNHVPEPVFPRRAEGRDPPAATEPDRDQTQRQAVHRPAQCAVDGPNLRRQRKPSPPAAGRVPLLQVSCSGAETDSAQNPNKPVHPLRGDCHCACRRQKRLSLDHVRRPSRVQTALRGRQGARAGAPDRVRGS
ncbi:hypothetical protein KL918_002867 [Ogataea parapolymorpha]|nr:hypothetical protein KL918_002867 [Ogataea parapolymorpha]KAG7871814.1 hypothetical protein KL916_003664 [Ogataea parapolymorpha]